MPGPYAFGAASEKELATCDERLQRLFREVAKYWNCKVIQGKRTEAEATVTRATGHSRTDHSRHVYPVGAPSLAADVSPYPVVWGDRERFYAFGGFVVGTAVQMGIKIRWGGDWDGDRDLKDQSFDDLPHFEVIE